MKKCPDEKILNPATNRCVKKDGKIGKKLLAKKPVAKKPVAKKPVAKKPVAKKPVAKKPVAKKPVAKKCPNDKVLNPHTNRCVKKDGKVGKKVLADHKQKLNDVNRRFPVPVSESKSRHKDIPVCRLSELLKAVPHKSESKSRDVVSHKSESKSRNKPSSVKGSPGIPASFRQVAEDCAKNKIWKKGKNLGSGKYGSVYVGCRVNNCDYAIKVADIDASFFVEVEALVQLQGVKGIPKLHAAWTCKDEGYLVIDKLERCSISIEQRYDKLKKVLKNAEKKGWLHVDTHTGNAMCKGTDMYLIDWGWAIKKGNPSYPDHPLSKKWKFPVTSELLEQIQIANFEENFGLDYDLYQDESDKADEMYEKAKKEYAEKKRSR